MRAKALVSVATFGLLFVLLCAATKVSGMPVESAWMGASLQTWDNFQPSGWISTTLVTCTIEVYNAGGFIDEAEYRYKAGGDWSEWTADGLEIELLNLTRRLLTVSGLSFSHSITEDQNQIQFRIKSPLDEWFESGAYLVRVDTVAPSSSVDVSPCYSPVEGISGLAYDSGSGVRVVEVALQRTSDSWYYDGASWTPTVTWITVLGTTTWSMPFTPTVETLYIAKSRATDNAGNVQLVPVHSMFLYDVTPPQSAITTTGCFSIWPGAILGMASDEVSGVAHVELTLQRMSDGLYYNGFSWIPTATWITATGRTSWSLPFTPTVETAYQVAVRAADNCGNLQSVPQTSAFTYDVTPPQSQIVTTGYFRSWPGVITGTATDLTSGVAAVQVTVQRALDGFYYNGSFWEPVARWITATGTVTWSLPFTPTVETVYTVTSRAVDHCGNVQSVSSRGVFVYDITPPESIVLTTGYFNTWGGQIQGTARDTLSGVDYVLIRLQRSLDRYYYDGLTWLPSERWITATGTISWTLPFVPSAEAVYTVTCRAVDLCGNVQEAQGIFTYDVTPPTSPFNIAVQPSTWTRTNSFTVTWESLADLSGIKAVHYKWNSAPTHSGDESPGSPVLLSPEGNQIISGLTVPTQGTHQLFIWLEDRAGNVNFQTRNATTVGAFKWDAQPPATTLVNVNGSQGCEGWYVSAVQVNLSAADVNPDPGTINATSGISATFWRKDGNSWQQVVGSSFQLTEQGVHTIEYYSVDVAGNAETPRVLTPTLKIDTVPPTTYQPNFTGTLGREGWYISPVTVTLSAVDATSGVSITCYQVDTDTLRTGNSFVVDADGAHIIRYYSMDMACNQEAVQTATLKIDRTYPHTAYELDGIWGDNGWFLAASVTQPVTVTLLASDAVTGVLETSGVDKLYHRIDSGTWQIRGATASFTVTIPAGQREGMRPIA
ncbi:MAG: Ig-like domain repeat protein, partial [Candidatus Hadarchaeum sp.]